MRSRANPARHPVLFFLKPALIAGFLLVDLICQPRFDLNPCDYVIDKSHFFQRLLATLREELLHAVNASKDAAEYATNEESRAESQWDTQGLEASYLAAGPVSYTHLRAHET